MLQESARRKERERLGIAIHVLYAGEVCVAPELPFGGERCNPIKASGVLAKKLERLCLRPWEKLACGLRYHERHGR